MNSASVRFITWKYAEYGEAGVCPAADLGESRYELHRGGEETVVHTFIILTKELTRYREKVNCRLLLFNTDTYFL